MNRDETPASKGPITIRAMTPQDIPFGLKLSAAAGWNQTVADWAMLLEQGPAGSFIASLDGIEAGTVTTVNYQGRLHWIGMVLVAEEHRRLGVGRALLAAAINSARGPVRLDATPAGKKLYDTLGFQEMYGLARWLRPPALLEVLPILSCPGLLPAMLPTVSAYDLPVFGADRAAILGALQRNARQLAFYAKKDGRLAGYCLGRYGRMYTQIGPVVADSLEIARDLFLSALHNCAQQNVIVDTTFHRPCWNQLLRDLGFVEQRSLIRMSLGAFTLPEQHLKQVAIAGPEIG